MAIRVLTENKRGLIKIRRLELTRKCSTTGIVQRRRLVKKERTGRAFDRPLRFYLEVNRFFLFFLVRSRCAHASIDSGTKFESIIHGRRTLSTEFTVYGIYQYRYINIIKTAGNTRTNLKLLYFHDLSA